jgi:hypothetical protein
VKEVADARPEESAEWFHWNPALAKTAANRDKTGLRVVRGVAGMA